MGFANRGAHYRRQRTIEVDGKKVTIVVVNRTKFANHVGFNVKVGEQTYVHLSLNMEEAFNYGKRMARERARTIKALAKQGVHTYKPLDALAAKHNITYGEIRKAKGR